MPGLAAFLELCCFLIAMILEQRASRTLGSLEGTYQIPRWVSLCLSSTHQRLWYGTQLHHKVCQPGDWPLNKHSRTHSSG